jgi:uncharacterized protein (DUF433 family)
MLFTGRIEMRPDVMPGKPVIRGTRISVELILRRTSSPMKSMSNDERVAVQPLAERREQSAS